MCENREYGLSDKFGWPNAMGAVHYRDDEGNRITEQEWLVKMGLGAARTIFRVLTRRLVAATKGIKMAASASLSTGSMNSLSDCVQKGTFMGSPAGVVLLMSKNRLVL